MEQLTNFNKILNDPENIKVKLEDEDDKDFEHFK